MIEMKLSTCNTSQFTCDDGYCVSMEQRCNQVPDCMNDKSDEVGCKMLYLEDNYNQRIPPFSTKRYGLSVKVMPVNVRISLTLLKVVAIEEEDHTIDMQFRINLEWKENRATFHNLKNNTYLNALSSEDINKLWLPLVIYTNTDQQETTRLGVEWEWTTSVWVKREEENPISSHDVPSQLDEIELFQGRENSLVMVQSYTHEFQCVYQLEDYPFDTQVRQFRFFLRSVFHRNA